ncbi:hypothetical protein K435DRAFT_916218, partial [Dendrothele bispora CBS 962.96]
VHRTDVAKFFEPSIQSIMNAVISQQKSCANKVDVVFLVGGFAANDYLFKTLTEFLKPTGLNLCRPQNYSNKAVADGALSFYLDHFVTSRIARWHYGTMVNTPFDASNPEHVLRKHTSYIHSATDERMIPDLFDTILLKNTSVAETTEFRSVYLRYRTESQIRLHRSESVKIYCYRGTHQTPKWLDQDADNYIALCDVEIDHQVPVQLYRNVLTGETCCKLEYSVILSFGLTELKAQVAWIE